MSKRTYTPEQIARRNQLQRERRLRLSPEKKAIEKEQARLRMTRVRANRTEEENIEHKVRRLDYDSKYYSDNKNTYCVYKHTNESGGVYFGSGNLLRPTNFRRRSKAWFKMFPNEPNVEIIATFNYKDLALLLESFLIRINGLDNLINQQQPKAIYKPL